MDKLEKISAIYGSLQGRLSQITTPEVVYTHKLDRIENQVGHFHKEVDELALLMGEDFKRV